MNNISIILVEPAISGNVGAIARSMANFGFENLILINSKCEIGEEARNRAKHAQKVLDNINHYDSFENLFEEFDTVIGTTGIIGTDYNITRSPVLPKELSEKLNEYNGRIALVFGRESDGLYNEELKKCDFSIHIPTNKEYSVLNLSHAVTIVLYELFSNKKSEEIKEEHLALTNHEKKVLLDVVEQIIDETKFATEDERENQKIIWNKFIGKAMLTKREGFGLIGFLKKLKK